MATQLYKNPEENSYSYFRNKKDFDKDKQEKLEKSSTLYIGNLSYKTTEIQLYLLFPPL